MKYTIDEIREKIMPVAIEHNVTEVYLFGSYAKNTATDESDIDLVINASNIHGLWGLIHFKEDVSQALQKPVDVLTLRAVVSEKDTLIKRDFFNNFINERICLYEQRS